ncbi:MAG: TolC family protein [Acidobacteria bacterium]|nr:TolC family protein [Acidobacteriota bacterium]
MLRVTALFLSFAAAAFAQISAFPSASYFRETFSPVVTKVELRPPARLDDFVVGNQLELSLRSYLELVMANNTEIQIQRLTVETAQNALTRALAPFDPLATARFTSERSRTPSNDALAGAATLSQLRQPATFTYAQTLQNGTNYQVQYFALKNATNSGFQNFNPAITSNLGFNFTQPLLRGRGAYVNRLPLMTARSRLRQTEYSLRDQVLRILAEAELAYWNVVQARENLRVREAALDLANKALERANKELELGAMSPLDIFQPQQQYATAEIDVSQSRYALRQAEEALRRQMGADLDPDIRRLPVELTETVLPPAGTASLDAELEVEKALASRPDLRGAIQGLDIDDLQIQNLRNLSKPDLSLIGGYTAQGRGGTFFQRSNVFTDAAGRSTIVQTIPGGFGDALDQMFGLGFPVYSFGLQLRLPIRDRRVAADLADALVQKRRDTLQVRSVEQTVRLDVLTAVNQVESSKASVKLAATALDFAQKYLDAEQKKYDLGTSQIFFVLQAQNSLVNAQSALVRESINYRRNLLNLLRRTGELLEARGVAVQ